MTILANKHRKQARNRMRANPWAARSAKYRALLCPEVIEAGRGPLQVVSRLSGEELERFRREWHRSMSGFNAQSAVFTIGTDLAVSFDIEPDVEVDYTAFTVSRRRKDGSHEILEARALPRRKDKA